MTKLFALITAACGVVVLSACGTTSTDQTGELVTKTSASTSSSSVEQLPNSQIVEWASGNEITIQSLTGPRVINFWASWCAPCREEMPLLSERFSTQELIGINSSDAGLSEFARSAAQAVLDESKIKYPIYIDNDDQLMHELGIVAFPVTLVVDSQFTIVKRIDGPITTDNVESIRKAFETAK